MANTLYKKISWIKTALNKNVKLTLSKKMKLVLTRWSGLNFTN